MKHKILFALALASSLLPPALRAGETNKWAFDVSLYGLIAGMSGEAGIGPVNANLDVGFDQILDHLRFGAMGAVRVGYDRWALSTELIYMDLEASKRAFTAEAKQWMVQPQLEYRVCRYFTGYAGTRYNSAELEFSGPLGIHPSNTEAWWDPIVGTRISLPIAKKWSFHVTGDIGGFDVGSDFTWQAFPYFNWEFAKHASLQVGYRFLSTDYEIGSGLNRFKYDVLIHGPQIGFTLHF
jgi:hypothetical protein